MNKLKEHMNKFKSIAFSLFVTAFAVALLVSTPLAHAQDYGSDGDCCGDYGSSYIAPADYGSSYIAPADYGSSYIAPADYGSSYIAPNSTYSSPTSYSSPSYYSSTPSYYSSTPSYSSSSYSSPLYYSSTPSYSSYSTYTPYSNTVRDNGNTSVIDSGNTAYNTTNRDNGNTSIFDSGNTSNTTSTHDNGNSCTTPGSCSTYSPYTSSVYSPSMVRDNGNSCTTPGSCSTTTTSTTHVHDNNNTIDSNNSCVQNGSCSTTYTSTDSHNIAISSPTTITTPITINSAPAAPLTAQILYIPPTVSPVAPQQYYPAPTCDLTMVQPVNGNPTLSWTSSNAVAGVITNVGNVASAGSVTVYPNQNTNYTATFRNSNNQTVTCSTYASAQVQRVVIANTPRVAAPYVTLSQVPYTGLELGPFGLVMYWSFLILACLFMAYLIVVKQAHIKLASTLKTVIFGTTEGEDTHSPADTHSAPHPEPAHAPAQPVHQAVVKEDAIDDFIMTQIHRA